VNPSLPPGTSSPGSLSAGGSSPGSSSPASSIVEPSSSERPTVAPVPDVLDDLTWRGLLAQSTDRTALAAALAAGPLTLYCGFDPTADSLHVGSLVPLLALRRFQLAGHRPIALAGGATGYVGDPSGRTAERVLITPEAIAARVERLRAQFQRFLELDGERGLLLDNYSWTAPMGVLEFLRDIGKHFPVAQMLARESVSARLEGGGLSFTEFSYQLLQSMDFLELYRRHSCRLQVGATDQWGNITAGLDLIRRVEPGSHDDGAHALCFPLVTDTSGAKIGKSTGGGSVWLDPAMTSPYALYQFGLNVSDSDVGSYLRLLTFVGRAEVERLDVETSSRPAARTAQRRFADELVAIVHGPGELARVQAASSALFGGGALEDLDAATLAAALAEAPSVSWEAEGTGGDADAGPLLVALLAEVLGLSRSAARRAVADGGAYLNNRRIEDEGQQAVPSDWLQGRYLVLRRGRRTVGVVQGRP